MQFNTRKLDFHAEHLAQKICVFAVIAAAYLFTYMYVDDYVAKNILTFNERILLPIYQMSNIAGPKYIILFAVLSLCFSLVCIWFARTQNRPTPVCKKLLNIAALSIVSGSLAATVSITLKNIHRARPFVTLHSNIAEIIYQNEAPLDSFPSGHSAAVFVAATSISIFYPHLRRYFIPIAIFFASLRFLCGLHYVSDVIIGAAIGISCPLFVMRTLNGLKGYRNFRNS